MKKVSKIWMDGKFIDWDKAKIHILTHTLHYGGGAFEGIRFYKTKKGPSIFRLKEHIDRLFYSSKCINIKIPYSKTAIYTATKELIKKNKLSCGYIRPIVYYGYGKMGLDPRGCPVNVSIITWPWGSYLGTKPVKVKISSFSRIHPNSTYADAKLCGHYVNSILSSLDVHKSGFDEALLLDHEGNLAEGPGENVFIVKNGILLTPKQKTILPGITRDCVFKIAKNEKIPAKEEVITRKILLSADEAFYCGTAAEITPISSIDRKKLKHTDIGPITSQIKRIYSKAVHGELDEYKRWLTIVK